MRVKDIITKDRLIDLFHSISECVNQNELRIGIYDCNFEVLIDKILEEETDEFLFGIITCDLCSHKWVGVIYSGTEKLECPFCSNMVNYTIK